jgi:peptide/nickel transport system substrate-binding protein
MSRALTLSGSSIDGRRGITTVVATILLVIILALVGVTSYALLGGFSTNKGTFTCAPADSPACGVYQNLHDLSLLLPFQSVPQNSSVPFTASLPAGESTTAFDFNFGDGTSNSTSATIYHHAYNSPGTYIVSATATVNGQQHDNYNDLIVVTVTPSFTAATAGTTPTIESAILGNTTVATKTASAVVTPTEFVELNASYTSNPTNPQFTPIAPHFVVPTGGTVTNVSSSTLSQTIKVSFASGGIYPVTFVGGASNGNTIAYENYTWTVFVAAAGTHASVIRAATHTSPHPGTLIQYELAPGGALSEDPAIDYETVGYEPILNVYQTLIAYNGSDTGPGWQEYVPVLATCVPGSTECQSLYGSSLVNGSDYTFVINPNASFYDPVTGNSWGVYPTDVFFSIARTMGFSTLPCVTCNNGWILTQALLSKGNGTWSGIHGSYNNTPYNISQSMTINSTSECPAAAMAAGQRGCITFHVDGNNKPWPYFLELIADGLGGSVVPCGWFSASDQAAGIPYWTQGNVSGSGDHPCETMGTPGWGIPVNQVPALGWDHWEQLGSGDFGTFQGHVQFNMAGSGPYYMADYEAGTAYTLKANPAYSANPDCTWHGCQPSKGQYASTVEVFWETSATPGEQAYIGGVADAASIPSTDFALLLQLISKGQVNAVTGPTLSIGFYPFNMEFSLSGAQRYATSQVSIPTDFFSYVGVRAFFAYSYPYQTIQTTINTVHGVELAFLSGGAIPQFMANYYPKDIPWPDQDPCTDASNNQCATYWWDQMHNSSSPFFDPEINQCTSSSPCEFPLFGETGSPALDETNALWSAKISSLSNGAIKTDPLDINFAELIGNSEFTGPGQNPMPLYSLGWAPDYPDPTDYVNPLYNANATYTNGDNVEQSLMSTQFASGSGCAVGITNATTLYYADNYVNNSCQGNAYRAMTHLLSDAATNTNLTERLAQYDEAEKIAFHLFLYVYTGQSNSIANAASWVDTSSFNTNVTTGAAGDTQFWGLTGNGVQYQGST